MKTTKVVRVNFLRIYSELQSAGEGLKLKAGALILMEEVGGNKAHTLTEKQLDNLASIVGINGTGKRAWRQLASLIGVGVSGATLTVEPCKKGDNYVDTDGVEKQYTKDWEKSTIDSIILPTNVTVALQKAVIEDVIKGWSDVVDLPVFDNLHVTEPELPGKTE